MIVLSVVSGAHRGETFQKDLDVLRVGSAADNDLRLTDEGVAPRHLHMVQAPGQNVVQVLQGACPVVVQWKEHAELVQEGQSVVVPDSLQITLGFCPNDQQARPTSHPHDFRAVIAFIIRSDDNARVVSLRHVDQLEPVRADLQRHPQILSKLDEVQRRVVSSVDLDDVLRAIADGVLELLPGATHVTVALRGEGPRGQTDDRTTDKVVVPVLTRVRGSEGVGTSPQGPVPVVRSIVRKVLQERAAVLAADAPRDVGKAESILGASIRSTAAVPLWNRDEIIGVVQADNRTAPGMLKASDLDVLAVFATTASLAVSNARLVRDLRVAHDRLSQENDILRSQTSRQSRGKKILGNSEVMRELMRQLDKVVDIKTTVLIEGETGTGKELIAVAIHERSNRSHRPFVVQNCAAFPSELLESELFGHKRGAFTGAVDEKKGLFDAANGGTLFLDEVGELPLPLQSKLLRVLQEGEVRPIGATHSHIVDVRIVAATNRNLKEMVDAGTFRGDLFYRLTVFPLVVPPLRERRDDIPILARAFVEEFSREFGKRVAGLTQRTVELLMAYDWPGNVRELQNEVQRLVIQADEGQLLVPQLLSPHIRGDLVTISKAKVTKGTLKQMMAQVEKYLLLEALDEHDGNKTQTAKALGITREGLHKKLRNYGIK